MSPLQAIGWCTVTSDLLKSQSSVGLTVAGISSTGSTYTPTANHDPDGDSNGTTLVIAKG